MTLPKGFGSGGGGGSSSADVERMIGKRVENMTGMICPHCGEMIEVFSRGGGSKISDEMNVELLGSIPLDPKISSDSDKGTPFVISHSDSTASKIFSQIVTKIEKKVEK